MTDVGRSNRQPIFFETHDASGPPAVTRKF